MNAKEIEANCIWAFVQSIIVNIEIAYEENIDDL